MRARCGACAGSGRKVVEPVPGVVRELGKCYRCRGKGWQSAGDARRNRAYDARRGR